MGTKCPGCQKVTTFEVSKEDLAKSGHKYNIVRCVLCQTAIGVTDYYNNAAQLLELREAIRSIAAKVGAVVKLTSN